MKKNGAAESRPIGEILTQRTRRRLPAGSLIEADLASSPALRDELLGVDRKRTPEQQELFEQIVRLPKDAFGKKPTEGKKIRLGGAVEEALDDFLRTNSAITQSRFVEVAVVRLLQELGDV